MENLCSPMQLTRGADYAVRAMIHMARSCEGTRFLLPDLARLIGAPENFLYKILQALRRAGFIQSRRGRSGGFQILPPGRNATIKSVVEAIDGPIRLNLCIASGDVCGRKKECPAHLVWARAQATLVRLLSSESIAALAKEKGPVRGSQI
jgi:Rrf2 family protein